MLALNSVSVWCLHVFLVFVSFWVLERMSLACRNESAYKMQATFFVRPLSGLYLLCESIRITITLSSWYVLLSVPVYAICIWCAFILSKQKARSTLNTHTLAMKWVTHCGSTFRAWWLLLLLLLCGHTDEHLGVVMVTVAGCNVWPGTVQNTFL